MMTKIKIKIKTVKGSSASSLGKGKETVMSRCMLLIRILMLLGKMRGK